MFGSDYPRGLVLSLRILWCAVFNPLTIMPALIGPLFLARLRRLVSLLCFPSRPFARRLPALRAAITLSLLPGMKMMLALFQQTTPRPRLTSRALPPTDHLPFCAGI